MNICALLLVVVTPGDLKTHLPGVTSSADGPLYSVPEMIEAVRPIVGDSLANDNECDVR